MPTAQRWIVPRAAGLRPRWANAPPQARTQHWEAITSPPKMPSVPMHVPLGLSSVLEAATARMGRLLDNLLSIQAFAAGEMRLQVQPFQLVAPVDDAAGLHAADAQEAGVDLRAFFPTSPVAVSAVADSAQPGDAPVPHWIAHAKQQAVQQSGTASGSGPSPPRLRDALAELWVPNGEAPHALLRHGLGDVRRLAQVVSTLLANAIRFSPQEG